MSYIQIQVETIFYFPIQIMLIKDITMTTVGVILFRILDEWIIYLQMLFQMKVS